MKIITVKTSSLKSHPKNPNIHPESQIKELQSSLDQFDQVKNIVVWQGQVIAGNGLLEAAKAQGRDTIEIKDVSDWLEEKAIKFMIADNRLAELSVIDDKELMALLGEFDVGDIPGIDEEFLETIGLNKEKGLTDPDEVPKDVEPVCKTGDLYSLEKHRLLCGDATKREDVERLMAGEKSRYGFYRPALRCVYCRWRRFCRWRRYSKCRDIHSNTWGHYHGGCSKTL